MADPSTVQNSAETSPPSATQQTIEVAPSAAAAVSASASRPDWVPESMWDAEKGAPKIDDIGKSYAELTKFKADTEARMSARPETADAYKLELPEGFKTPEGVDIKFDPVDPLVSMAREIAHAAGMDQAAFSGLLAKRAEQLAADHAAASAAYQAEVAKLGEKGVERIRAAAAFLPSVVSADEAKAIETGRVDLAVFWTGLEKLGQKVGQAVPPGSGPAAAPRVALADRLYGGVRK